MRAVGADQATQASGPGATRSLLKIACVRPDRGLDDGLEFVHFVLVQQQLRGRARPVRHLRQAGPAVERVRCGIDVGGEERDSVQPHLARLRDQFGQRRKLWRWMVDRAATRTCGARRAACPPPRRPRAGRRPRESPDTGRPCGRPATRSRSGSGPRCRRRSDRARGRWSAAAAPCRAREQVRHRHHVGTHQRLAARQHHDARAGAWRSAASVAISASDRSPAPSARHQSHDTQRELQRAVGANSTSGNVCVLPVSSPSLTSRFARRWSADSTAES